MKVVSTLMFNILLFEENLMLALDRTNWKSGEHDINILMLGVSYKNVAFPLMFRMLDKIGNADTEERINLIKNIFDGSENKALIVY
jgi:hypothetical protein